MKPLVVLLHGLARGHGSMAGMGRFLRAHGFDTFGRTYPSRRHSIAYLANQVTSQIVEHAGDRPVSAVTHSMGGVIVRHLHDPRIRWHRIVMLAPPNRGSRLAAAIHTNPIFRWYYGPAGAELAGVGDEHVGDEHVGDEHVGDGRHPTWPQPPAPFAVIAGTRGLALSNPTSWTMGRRFAPGIAHDGTVAVEETRLPGMSAFAEVDATHTWIMNDARTRSLVLRYLTAGDFESPVS